MDIPKVHFKFKGKIIIYELGDRYKDPETGRGLYYQNPETNEKIPYRICFDGLHARKTKKECIEEYHGNSK